MTKNTKFVQVQPLGGFSQALSYGIPKSLEKNINVGSLVRISVGSRRLNGIVTSFSQAEATHHYKLKDVSSIVQKDPVLNDELIRLATWISSYYYSSIEYVLEGMIPSAVKNGMHQKTERYVLRIRNIDVDKILKDLMRSPQQKKLFLHICNHDKPLKLNKVLKELAINASSANSLIKKNYIKLITQKIERTAYNDEFADSVDYISPNIVLTKEQKIASKEISDIISKQKFKAHLLQGVTGSGKTEVYFKAMEEVLKKGGGVLFLVPEVALAPQTVSRLRNRFSKQKENVVVWHSHLSDGERLDAWSALANGKSRIVVGARSAIFAPVQNLKLIIVDEEHEPSYKQEESPRYHARDVSVYRAMLNDAVCLLGSATPSMESLHNVNTKKYSLSRLKKRIDGREMPLIHLVDMRKESKRENTAPILSQALLDALRQRFYKREQSILFLNRRGFNTTMLCPDCGEVQSCKDCSISLTYHRTDSYLRCHICGYRKPVPKVCPNCKSFDIIKKGHGTQRIEDIVEALLPKNVIIRRVDADVMTKKNLFRETLDNFRKGKIDILVGTQMIAKGLDFPNVTLVGVIDADLPLRIEDFRASERSFQLLTQVSGRAGRGDRAGEVFIQTYSPHSSSIQFSRKGDVAGFMEEEEDLRKEYKYPPFRHLIRHIFKGRNKEKTYFYADQWGKIIRQHSSEIFDIKGPAPAPLEKIKGYYRFHLFYFANQVPKFLKIFDKTRSNFPLDKDISDVVDIDAHQLS